MTHYAFLNEQNIVTEVIMGLDETGDTNWEQKYGEIRNQVCKRTSFNTHGGIYYDPETNQPSSDQSKSYRKNYASIGYTYNYDLDGFIPQKPHESWILNEETCLWDPPIPYPSDGQLYFWYESAHQADNTAGWMLVDPPVDDPE